jgi:hypothetical protein
MNKKSNVMSDELKKKLYDYEVKPPDGLWNKISGVLDDENVHLAQKLYDAEFAPQAEIWGKISTELDIAEIENYPARLYRFEANPPSYGWQKVSDALEETNSIHEVIPKRKISLFIRYAAAACLVGIIAFCTLKFINYQTHGHLISDKAVVHKNSLPVHVPQQPGETLPAVHNNLPEEGTLLAQANGPVKSIAQRIRFVKPQVSGETITDDNSSLACDFEQASLNGDIPGNCPVVSDADRYSTYVNPDGYLIRISKKLGETLGCNYTHENTEKNDPCESQIKKWSDKISQTPNAPGPDNFMNIVNIIRSVQDE